MEGRDSPAACDKVEWIQSLAHQLTLAAAGGSRQEPEEEKRSVYAESVGGIKEATSRTISSQRHAVVIDESCPSLEYLQLELRCRGHCRCLYRNLAWNATAPQWHYLFSEYVYCSRACEAVVMQAGYEGVRRNREEHWHHRSALQRLSEFDGSCGLHNDEGLQPSQGGG